MIQKIKNIFVAPMTLTRFILISTLATMLLYHLPLYRFAIANLNMGGMGGIATFGGLLVLIFLITMVLFLLFGLIGGGRFVRVFILATFVMNGIALYFIDSYQVVLDKSMMGNLFNTNTTEASNFYHPKVFIYIFLLGLLPLWLLARVEILPTKRISLLKPMVVTIVLGLSYMYLNASTWLWLDQNAKRIGGMNLPWAYLINATRYQLEKLKSSEVQTLLPNATTKDHNKTIVLLIIGESARAANFSLYGYPKETNPELKKLNTINLKARSETTYTTASVHTMLSFKGATSDDYEPLPSYLQRQGVDVVWHTGNWGEPKLKVAAYQRDDDLVASCKEDCDHDGVLLTGLAERIAHSKSDKIFITLHTSGSHGPTYYKKYPKEFEHFKPVCQSVDLETCTQEELINAYDNSILYTDHFIAKTIAMLESFSDTPTLLIYLSDHGESLGEYGLYLHGTPYTIAPDVQKDIPLLLWLSKPFQEKYPFDVSQIDKGKTYGQKYIFHTIMGALGLEGEVYDKKMDILKRE